MLVTIELGATLPFADYGNVKPLIRIEGIDPEGDVEEQIKQGVEVSQRAFARINEQLDVSVSEIIAPDTGKPGYRQKVETLESSLKEVIKVQNKIMKALKDADIKPLADKVNGKESERKGS